MSGWFIFYINININTYLYITLLQHKRFGEIYFALSLGLLTELLSKAVTKLHLNEYKPQVSSTALFMFFVSIVSNLFYVYLFIY